MSPEVLLTVAQQAVVDRLGGLADGGHISVVAVSDVSRAVLVAYRYGGRRQSRIVLGDGYVAQGYSDPIDAPRRRR